jgi:hypothetical protein
MEAVSLRSMLLAVARPHFPRPLPHLSATLMPLHDLFFAKFLS